MLPAVVVALAAWLVPRGPDADGTREGHALGGGWYDQADFGNESLRTGKEYWVSLPQAWNVSGEPVTVLKARFVSLPKGLELIGYKVVSTEDTDGFGMGSMLTGSPADDITGLPERPNAFTVKARRPADWYHVARIRVSGPVTGDTSRCRFWYRQGSVTYRQDLRCVNQLRLARK
ncbi:hypothetical protein [Streptomyces sp. NPDC091209]|uniref:hypothetical protein n=1 Tax=Streptomyces sp. NPDC091209 TaxID=3365974 RepID=UPI00382A2C4B